MDTKQTRQYVRNYLEAAGGHTKINRTWTEGGRWRKDGKRIIVARTYGNRLHHTDLAAIKHATGADKVYTTERGMYLRINGVELAQ
jgi:hypothetical protein